jgi:hypothetical protein
MLTADCKLNSQKWIFWPSTTFLLLKSVDIIVLYETFSSFYRFRFCLCRNPGYFMLQFVPIIMISNSGNSPKPYLVWRLSWHVCFLQIIMSLWSLLHESTVLFKKLRLFAQDILISQNRRSFNFLFVISLWNLFSTLRRWKAVKNINLGFLFNWNLVELLDIKFHCFVYFDTILLSFLQRYRPLFV